MTEREGNPLLTKALNNRAGIEVGSKDEAGIGPVDKNSLCKKYKEILNKFKTEGSSRFNVQICMPGGDINVGIGEGRQSCSADSTYITVNIEELSEYLLIPTKDSEPARMVSYAMNFYNNCEPKTERPLTLAESENYLNLVKDIEIQISQQDEK